MRIRIPLIAGVALGALMAFTPLASAQEGSMQVGGATVSVGAGTALLILPDVDFTFTSTFALATFIGTQTNSELDEDDIGYNINGGISVPAGGNAAYALDGFFSQIDSDDTVFCQTTAANRCGFSSIALVNGLGSVAFIDDLTTTADREVDHWGVSLERKQYLNPGVSGVTRAPHQRYWALGADYRVIDQDLRLVGATANPGNGNFVYNEDLDTDYFGVYAALGGGYTLPFIGNMTSGLGLRSTFRLWGGIYMGETDYDGRYVGNIIASNRTDIANLKLSDDETTFIGGLTLETKKRLGSRAALSLKSEYEYYSWVPEMSYLNGTLGSVTRIGSDDAFSARTSLRLTIKLGPDAIMEPAK